MEVRVDHLGNEHGFVRMVNRRKIRNAYISAPAGASLQVLRELLAERKVKVLVPYELEAFQSFGGSPFKYIAEADLVIGILTHESRSQWVLFELGQAAALDKQIVVIAPPKSDLTPDILPLQVTRVSLHNRKALGFIFDQMLAAPERNLDLSSKLEANGVSLGSKVDELSSDFQKLAIANDGRGFEHLVATTIRLSKVEIVTEALFNNRRFDLAVWSDALQTFVGNPLLVEVKLRLRNETSFRKAVNQCFLYAAGAGSTWSLLIYGEGPNIEEKRWMPLGSTVLIVRFDRLLESLRTRSFAEIVIGLRNVRVHGRAMQE